jgi:hypothetical protein
MESRKYRWLYATGAAVACAGVLVAANVAFARDRGSGAGFEAGAAPAALSSTPAPTPAPTPSADGPSTPAQALGTVIDTGLKAKTGDWVFYLVAIKEPQLPKTHFGLMLGRRLPDGTLTADVVTNETSGSDLAKGFHAGQGSMAVDGGTTPTFGYYVGPAAKITAKAHGKTVTAGQAISSKYPGVRVYWFAPGVSGITGVTAYDTAGRKISSGATFGVG